jgi:hypothetical protein
LELHRATVIQARFRALAFCTLCALGLAGASSAQGLAGAPVRAGNSVAATRDGAQFLALERALQEALGKRDWTAIAARLAQDFSVRLGPLLDGADAEAWMQQEFAAPLRPRTVRDLSVRHVNGLAIVSFYLQAMPAAGTKAPTDFVVDVWSEADEKLHTRITNPTIPLPPVDKRPTGRD